MSVAQVLRQAEELKAAVQDTSRGSSEAWVSRQNLQDLYQKLLVLDLEYALDKKVEQDLWNHAFKNQINTLQNQAKDKQNPKKPEIVASLNLFLETASGFYLQLLEELCSAFKLDLPCRRRATSIGILKEYGPVANKIKAPKKSSCMYICQHCLVHLGDIARYREQSDQAQTYYKHAASLVPYNGQPYNQLAILEAARGNKLSTVVYYVRSIAVKHPFPVACTNLEKFYSKITKDIPESGRKLSMSELTISFLQFNALVHLSTKLPLASSLSQKILSSLPSHISSMSYSSYQLVQMITVLLYTLHHSRRRLSLTKNTDNQSKNNNKNDQSEKESSKLDQSHDSNQSQSSPKKKREVTEDDKKGHELCFSVIASLLEQLLSLTPVKQESKAKEYHTLPAIKVLLDWLRADPDLITSPQLTNNSIYQNLSKLLNVLQFNTNQKDVPIDPKKYVSVPLPEDCELQCFLPIQISHSDLDFHLMPAEGLSQELEMRLRCQRLVEHGVWLCEEFPSLNLINLVQKQKSGRLHFSVPGTQGGNVSAGTDTDSGSEKKSSHRHNVAIQAIMQHKKDTSTGPTPDSNHSNPPSNTSTNSAPGSSGKAHGKGSKKGQKVEAEKPKGNQMVNTFTETQEPEEKPIPAWVWAQPGQQGPYLATNQQSPWGQQNFDQSQQGFEHAQQSPSGKWFGTGSGGFAGDVDRTAAAAGNKEQPLKQNQGQFFENRTERFPSVADQRSKPPSQMTVQIQQLDKVIGQTAEQLKQVSQQIQQTKIAAQRDPDIVLLQQQSQLAPQHAAILEQKLRDVYSRYQEALARDLVAQQQLQQQQQQLLQQRQALVESSNETERQTWQQQQQPSPMDLSQSLAVMELAKKQQQQQQKPMKNQATWGQTDSNAARPNSLPAGQNLRRDNTPFVNSPQSQSEFQPYSPVEPSKTETSTTQFYLEKLFMGAGAGPNAQPKSPQQAGPRDEGPVVRNFGPLSYDSDEELCRAAENMQGFNPQPGSRLLTSDLSSLVIDLARMSEEVPKPDSPPLSVSLYNKAQDTNTYSLFSQSPWTVQLSSSSADTKSHTSSSPAFGSSGGSSLRTTPDLHPPEDRTTPAPQRTTPAPQRTTNMGPQRTTNPPQRTNPTPPGLGGIQGLGFNLTNPAITTATDWNVPPGNTQSMWSAGPSPLQKLLQQQKNQRQNDPH